MRHGTRIERHELIPVDRTIRFTEVGSKLCNQSILSFIVTLIKSLDVFFRFVAHISNNLFIKFRIASNPLPENLPGQLFKKPVFRRPAAPAFRFTSVTVTNNRQQHLPRLPCKFVGGQKILFLTLLTVCIEYRCSAFDCHRDSGRTAVYLKVNSFGNRLLPSAGCDCERFEETITENRFFTR